MSTNKAKTVLLGVAGGIAAYKAAALASRLHQAGCRVDVIMTANACEFIAPLTFETLTGRPCVTSAFARSGSFEVEHISLAQAADLVVIAPATANVIAKMANGIADDMLTTTVLAARCSKLVFPAMNTGMYENPATQQNIDKLRKMGVVVAEPGSGLLACGEVGKGRLPEPEEMLAQVQQMLNPNRDLAGRKLLVTAGATREAIDPVRFITNHSTGKMGYAVAAAAARRGAEVTLVSAPTALQPPAGVRRVPVTSAQEMYEAVTQRAAAQDLFVFAAAVADYRPRCAADHKIKKQEGGLSLQLERTPDILQAVCANRKPGQRICGFSMETENLLENSAAKLRKKGADMMVANSLTEPGAGFGVDTNRATILTPEGAEPLPLMSKAELADRILDRLAGDVV